MPTKIAIMWFDDRVSVVRAIDPDFLGIVSPIQIISARNHVTEFLRDRFDHGAMVVGQSIAGSEEEDYEVLCHAPRAPAGDDGWACTASQEGDTELEDLSVPSFDSRILHASDLSQCSHRGIPNLGNTCYLSACRQALLHFPSGRPLVPLLPDHFPQMIEAYKRFSSSAHSVDDLPAVLCALSDNIPEINLAQDASEVLRLFLSVFVEYSPDVRQFVETCALQSVLNENDGIESC
jgi:hypothetical protein